MYFVCLVGSKVSNLMEVASERPISGHVWAPRIRSSPFTAKRAHHHKEVSSLHHSEVGKKPSNELH
jgi:hypothetical protein